jgi:proteasome lid subunit RPN8/RPN11
VVALGKPAVYLNRDAFRELLFAAVETGQKECLGILFGWEVEKGGHKIVVSGISGFQSLVRRKNTEVVHSQAAHNRIQDFMASAPSEYQQVGHFHSHCEWMNFPSSPEMSKGDIDNVVRTESKIEIIILIAKRKRGQNIRWSAREDGGVEGTTGKWSLGLHAYQVAISPDGSRRAEKLNLVVSPRTLALFSK